MERIWLKNYPKGVPANIDADAYTSLVALIDESLIKFAVRPAFANMGKTLTFGDIDKASRLFGAYLLSRGLVSGDRIALMMPNMLQYPIALFGALRAGLIIVNTNPLYTPREMLHQFNDSGVKAIVIAENFASHLEQVIEQTSIKTVIVTSVGEMLGWRGILVNFVIRRVRRMVPKYTLKNVVTFQEAVTAGRRFELPKLHTQPEDIAFLQYTGGTTGVSKGAILTHRNMIANAMQMLGVLKPLMADSGEVALCPLPLYHVFACTVNVFGIMSIGGLNVLVTNPRDLGSVIKEFRRYPISIMIGVNTLFNGLLNREDFRKCDFAGLKITVGGAMAVQRAVADRWKTVTGNDLTEGYGLTEASPVVAVNPLDGTGRNGTIGLPLPSTEIEIMDEDGNPVQLGEEGELCVRGPQVMAGYYNSPDETDKVLRGGWLFTGDMATIDTDGFLRIVDRKKDMILVSGFNVYPNEIEDVMMQHPKVLEVAAVGVPDPKAGEAVKVFIVKKDASLTESEVRAHCRENLTAYKNPKYIIFRTELPETNVGKVLRRMLRDEK